MGLEDIDEIKTKVVLPRVPKCPNKESYERIGAVFHRQDLDFFGNLKTPHKPHLLRLQKSLISDSAQNLKILTWGKLKGFCDNAQDAMAMELIKWPGRKGSAWLIKSFWG